MKKLFILAVPILLATTLLLATSLANVNTFGQMGNQTSAMGNQTSSQGNQTGGNMNVKLFTLVGQAIAAQKDDNSTGLENVLGQMQQSLSQATGKQIVVVPTSDSDSGHSSDSGSKSGSDSGSKSGSDSGSKSGSDSGSKSGSEDSG